MMLFVKTIQNPHFVGNKKIHVFYNTLDEKYHVDFNLKNPMGTLGIFNDIQIANDIYVLAIIDAFCRMCQEEYERMVGV